MKSRFGLSLLVVAVVGCATEAEDTLTSTTTTTLQPVSTTMPTTSTSTSTVTTTSTTTPTVFPPLDSECPPVMVVGDDITGVGPDCSATRLAIGETDSNGAMFRVMDDMAGGLLYQTDRNAILWLEAGADRAVALVEVEAAGAESVDIEDVVVIGEAVELWFTRWRGQDWEDFEDLEDLVQTLERVVIDGGEPTVVAQIGGYESGSSVTVGGEVVAIENRAEGFYYFAVSDLEMDRLPQPWNPYDEPEDVACEQCPTNLIVSDDGSRAVFLTPAPQEATILPVLVVVDLESGEELARLEVSGLGWPYGQPAEGPEVTGIDMLGDLVLVNGADEGQPFPAIWTDLGDDEPVWEEMQFRGSARFLRSDVQFEDLDTHPAP